MTNEITTNTLFDPAYGNGDYSNLKLGSLKLPDDHLVHKSTSLGDLLGGTLPVVPKWVNNAVPGGKAPMFMNDTLGCCTVATVAHMLRVFTYLSTGKEYVLPDTVVADTYKTLGGVGDSGLVPADVLNYWTSTGISDSSTEFEDKILGFAPVNFKNPEEFNVALWFFDAVYCGSMLPKTTGAQFKDYEIFTVVDKTLQGNSAPGSLGGHAFPVVRRNGQENHYGIYTWGEYQPVTTEWLFTYLDCVYVVVSTHAINKLGRSNLGFDTQQLLADMKMLNA